MEISGTILLWFGIFTCVVASLWFLALAFRQSALWGLGCLIIPFFGLVFLIMHWDKGRRPFFVNVAGLALVMIGATMMGTTP